MFDVVAAREAWSEMIAQCEADKLVFPDESGVNMDLGRRYSCQRGPDAFTGAGMKLLYLPAYSPDLNPIEHMRSKIKAALRKLKIRLLSLLPHGIAEAFPRVRLSDCAGWFSAAGIPC